MGPQINADAKIQRKEVDFKEIKPPALRNGEKRFRKTNNRAAEGGYTKTQSQSEGETNTKQGLTRQLRIPQGKGNNKITPLTNQQTTMNPRRANESCKGDLNPKWAEFSNFCEATRKIQTKAKLSNETQSILVRSLLDFFPIFFFSSSA